MILESKPQDVSGSLPQREAALHLGSACKNMSKKICACTGLMESRKVGYNRLDQRAACQKNRKKAPMELCVRPKALSAPRPRIGSPDFCCSYALCCTRRATLAARWREKLVMAALPDLAVKSTNHMCQHGCVTIGDMIRLTGEEPKQGHLVRHGTGKATCYTLP